MTNSMCFIVEIIIFEFLICTFIDIWAKKVFTRDNANVFTCSVTFAKIALELGSPTVFDSTKDPQHSNNLISISKDKTHLCDFFHFAVFISIKLFHRFGAIFNVFFYSFVSQCFISLYTLCFVQHLQVLFIDFYFLFSFYTCNWNDAANKTLFVGVFSMIL